MRDSTRQYVFLGLMVFVFLTYAARLFYLQVIDTKYRLQADNNAIQRQTIFPARGLIYDRHNKLIVSNLPLYDLKVIAEQVPSNFDTLAFCELINLDKKTFKEKLEKIANDNYLRKKAENFITQISPETFAQIQEKLYQYPGFFGETRTVRNYNYPNAAHVLGYIGEVNNRDINRNAYYAKGDYIGISGVEFSYEEELRGKKGVKRFYIDALRRIQGAYQAGAFDTAAISGANLQLTLDINLQAYAEQLMQNKRGAIVAIEPATGEILTFVSSPEYNPENLVGRKRAKAVANLQQDTLKPLFNRAIMSSQNPPGSTLKLLQALIGFQEGVLNENTSYSCHSGFRVSSKHRLGCHAHRSPLKFKYSITTSCNAYYCHVFRSIIDKYPTAEEGLNVWTNYLSSFGLGKKLGVDLPNELGGLTPTSAFYDRYYGKGGWKSMTIISLAIGQGELGLTPLQMANLSATLANRGFYITPHLGKKIENKAIKDSLIQKHYTPIDKAYYELVVDAMHNVVENGTGRIAKIKDIEVCGKTGTAQNPQGEDHSIFIAFAPKENPQIALAVYVENGGFGATWAAPIAGLIIEKYLNDTIAKQKNWIEEKMLKGNLNLGN